MQIDTVLGDAAYSWKENLAYAKAEKFQLISKLNTVITNGSGQRKIEFDYNKDAERFVWTAGHLATHKRRTSKKSSN